MARKLTVSFCSTSACRYTEDKAVCAAKTIKTLGYWALMDLSLLSQGSHDSTEILLQYKNCEVL